MHILYCLQSRGRCSLWTCIRPVAHLFLADGMQRDSFHIVLITFGISFGGHPA